MKLDEYSPVTLLLIYPDFNKSFDIRTDASELNLGAVIIQNGKPIAFCSCKLTIPHTVYSNGK